MTGFSRFTILMTTLFSISILSCSGSSSGTSTGWIVDPTELTAAAAMTTTTSSLTYSGITFNAKNFATITQTEYQTGVGLAVFSTNGNELAKMFFYINTGSATMPIPIISGATQTYTSLAGAVIWKWASDATNSTKTALNYLSTSGNITFTVTYNSTGVYTVSGITLPDGSVADITNVLRL